MNKNIISFIVGAVVGAVSTFFGVNTYLKKQYDDKMDEEIQSVKDSFRNQLRIIKESYDRQAAKETDISNPPKVQNEIDKKEDTNKTEALKEYENIKRSNNYICYSDAEQKGKEDEVEEGKPYVITGDQFGEYPDYDAMDLLYFADGVLTDDDYNVIEDIDATISKSSLDHFGEYEEDTVYVRNDELACDYNVTKDERNYADLANDL